MYEKEEWYAVMQMDDLEFAIGQELLRASQSFVAIGYYLKNIRDRGLFVEAGFATIWDYAQKRFRISRSNASRYMAINDRFSVGGNSPELAEEYSEFGSAKLQEMLTLPDEQLKKVSPEMTRKEIRDLKKAKENTVMPAHPEMEGSNFCAPAHTEKTPLPEKQEEKPEATEGTDDSSAAEDCQRLEQGTFPTEQEDGQGFVQESSMVPEESCIGEEQSAPPKQPDLPKLKNNEQRKAFIAQYTTWPIWIELELTGERYYRYNLSDKVAIVVKVSLKHEWKNYRESKEYIYGAERYYLLGIRYRYGAEGSVFQEDDTRTFYECETNKSSLVDYLKEIQRK